MTVQFSPYERYFDQDGKPTGLGQQLFLRLNQLFAAQDAGLALTNTTLVATNASLAGTQADVTTAKGNLATARADLTALTGVVALKAPLASPVFTGVPVAPSYTVTTLPPATAGGLIYVSNEVGGAVLAFADGTNFRRVTDRAIVS